MAVSNRAPASPATGRPTDRPVSTAPATPVETLLTVVGGLWLVAGLFIDGYAHSEIIDTETEDFFTPWHAVFYSGFAFTAGVIGWIASRRARSGPLRAWLPVGYGWAAIGVAVFAAGGIGDGIWHTIFGVETGIDALLSPTHLLLFVGMALILTAPLRAHWHGPDPAPTWGSSGMAVVATTIATALVVFFFTYGFGLGENFTHRVPFDPAIDGDETLVALGLSSAYVATALLAAPVLTLLRRGDLPPGAVALLWAVPSLLNDLAFGGEGLALPSALAGGVAVEVGLRLIRPVLGRRRAVVVALGLGTAVMWSVWMALTAADDRLAWVPELWTGQIVMSALVAMGLALLVFPPPTGSASNGTLEDPVR